MFAKIVAVIGGIFTSGFGIIKAFKWVVKIRKIVGMVRKFFKEGKDVVVEGMDIKPAAEKVIKLGRIVKFGDTSPENIERMENLSRASIALAVEAQQVIKEINDVQKLIKDLKNIL